VVEVGGGQNKWPSSLVRTPNLPRIFLMRGVICPAKCSLQMMEGTAEVFRSCSLFVGLHSNGTYPGIFSQSTHDHVTSKYTLEPTET
jgi:hypothetical protein